jgi:hypothetical protein
MLYTDQKRRAQGVLRPEGPGQLRGWKWGVFYLRGQKDVLLVTLQFHHRGIRCWSYVRSVTEYAGDPTGWQPKLAIGAANSVTSARIAWARELLRNPWHQLEFTCLFQESQKGERKKKELFFFFTD